MMIANMVDLSTLHVPREYPPDFGGCRYADHEEGWIVFVEGDLESTSFEDVVPLWLRPIYKYAQGINAILINFDSDADIDTLFEIWE